MIYGIWCGRSGTGLPQVLDLFPHWSGFTLAILGFFVALITMTTRLAGSSVGTGSYSAATHSGQVDLHNAVQHSGRTTECSNRESL